MRSIARLCLAMAVLMATTITAPRFAAAADTLDAQHQFQMAFSLVEDYREEILGFQIEVIDTPRLTLLPTYHSTVATLGRMRDLEVQPCLAEWWANEYTSLKLAGLYTLYMQGDSTTPQVVVDYVGWLADRFHRDADTVLMAVNDACAPPASAG